MQVQQISIFMENRAGRLQEITGIISKADINIRALSLADTSDFGILRVIVDKPKECQNILREHDFVIRENKVIACTVDDKPGGLYHILDLLGNAGISIEYMYGFLERRSDNAVMIIRVEDDKKAIQVLLDAGVHLLKGEEIYSI